MSTTKPRQPNVPVKTKKTYINRTQAKEKRLKMYNSSGKLSNERPDTKIAPDRRYFGNTRTITQDELSNFRNAFKEVKSDQYQVLLHERKLPKSLVHDEEEKRKYNLLKAESFKDTFGKKAQRRRPEIGAHNLKSLVEKAQEQNENFEIAKTKITTVDANKDVEMGQTKRILGEVYKVIDSSDVIIEVLDARDPLGTRSRKLEEFMAKETPHKHLVFLINKCDLVPKWVVEKAVRRLSRERPTLAFRASTENNAFGTEQLIALLRQFQILHKDRAHLCVGLVGYPNVGKSSVINALRREKVCPVAPVPGETKVWRYVSLTKRIYLIDCPGHVYPEDITDAERILRSVTRTERIDEPEHYIQYIVDRVRPQYLTKTYGIETFDGPDDLLDKIARRHGRLIKGGKPDIHDAAIKLIRDFQRGKIPWFVLVHSKDIENPLQRRVEVKVSHADLRQVVRTVEFDPIDEQEVIDEQEAAEDAEIEKMEAEDNERLPDLAAEAGDEEEDGPADEEAPKKE
ncbi:hypothetical protein TRFO_04861 [Tritrichomonas foetus]|uniref:Nucleolar GTP-binding protein 2 n=1 Tax=Tritrichomonas foetus TaxID=1144522 RepID=A0A1J4KCS7_9EUKA|nr:hypothetical protein TRFO_04861 [Tritrichomonas foetus]|eukprot:OHT08744.1 hypothetical protein TRFO_04861 [Tritrichomonas foetus]